MAWIKSNVRVLAAALAASVLFAAAAKPGLAADQAKQDSARQRFAPIQLLMDQAIRDGRNDDE